MQQQERFHASPGEYDHEGMGSNSPIANVGEYHYERMESHHPCRPPDIEQTSGSSMSDSMNANKHDGKWANTSMNADEYTGGQAIASASTNSMTRNMP